jgi:hypothetical protein
MVRYDAHSTYSKKRCEVSKKSGRQFLPLSIGQACHLYYIIYNKLPPQNTIKLLLSEDVMPCTYTYTCTLQNTDRFIKQTVTNNT